MRLGNGTIGLIVAVVALLIGALGSGSDRDAARAGRGQDSVRRPAPEAAPETAARAPEAPLPGRVLPPTSRQDPEFKVELGPKRDSSGTAFSIEPGVWMTARHVADGCAKVGIVTGPRHAVRGGAIMVHQNADLALFRAPVKAAPVAIAGPELRIGQAGYHFGFPRGEPGAMRSSLIGRAVMRESGRYSTREPVLVWAEVTRVPDRSEPLSGISGGPVFDATGRLVGVHVAGSIRRGRSFTTAPRSIRELLARAGVTPAADGPVPPLHDDDFARVGERLRKDLVVAKAICLAQ